MKKKKKKRGNNNNNKQRKKEEDAAEQEAEGEEEGGFKTKIVSDTYLTDCLRIRGIDGVTDFLSFCPAV